MAPKELTIGLIGFGNAGRAFLRLLLSHRRRLISRYNVRFRLTGIATASHGIAVSAAGIDMGRALRCVESGKSVARLHVGRPIVDTFGFIRRRPAQILFELTPLDPLRGMPGVEHIRRALERGMDVVTANKGPVALAYRPLCDLARAEGRHFRFEGTVMDGTPLFNLVEKTLPGTCVLGFRGILNSTTNYILTEMEKGRSFDSALRKARAKGITEADPTHDISGWDTATKTAVLANVLMGANLRPKEIPRRGIEAIRTEDLDRARKAGKVLRLVASASRERRKVRTRVAPVALKQSDPLANVAGTSSALAIQTDIMKELIIIENDGGIEETAYALYSDLLTIVNDGIRREK